MKSTTKARVTAVLRGSVRRLAIRVRGSEPWYQAIWAHDRGVTALHRVFGSVRRQSDGPTAVIAASGHGNIGDQAMLESVLDNTPGEIVVILDSPDAAVVPERNAARVSVVALPNLIDGQPWSRTHDVIRFVRLMIRCRRLHVIGADLMDGLYNPTGSIARSSCLRTAVDLGLRARVLGFSWSANAHPSAVRALAEAGSDVECMAREPLSAERLSACGIRNVTSVADTVFRLDGTQEYEPFDTWIAGLDPGRRVALVNMSALVGKRIDQTDEYRRILSDFAKRGYAVALVPHVMRDSGDDSHEISKLSSDDLPADALVIDELLSPLQIRHLAAHAQLVVTGRMHLAIMSIGQTAVPITLGTQGKVEGLYKLLRVGNLEVDPTPGFGARVVDLVSRVDGQLDDMRRRLAEDLPGVRRLAGLNFAVDSPGDCGATAEPAMATRTGE